MERNGRDEPFSLAGDAFSASVAEYEAVVPPPPSTEEHSKGWEVVPSAVYDDDCSIFPPSRHEGLHLRPDADIHPSLSTDRDPEPSSPAVEEEEWVRRARRVLESARRLVACGVELFDDKIRFSGTMWSYAGHAAVAAAVAAVVLARRRHRNEKNLLLLLLQEKDQRINLLLQQIELMKEITAANHQVSILRKA